MKEKIIEHLKKINFSEHLKRSNILDKMTSVYLYPEIPDKKQKNARKTHRLDIHEEIFYLKDNTLFGSATESFIITEKGLSIVEKGSKPAKKVSWSRIHKVEYIDENFYFFFDVDNNNKRQNFHRSLIITDFNDSEEFYNSFAKQLSEIAIFFEDKEQSLYKEIEKLYISQEYDKLVQSSGKFFNKYGDKNEYAFDVHFLTAKAFYALNIPQKALSEIEYCIFDIENEKLNFYDETNNGIPHVYSLKADILQSLNKNYEALKNYKKALEHSAVKSEILLLEQKIKTSNEKIKNHFFHYQYQDRKLILIDNQQIDISSNLFKVLRKDNLPDIKFPIGHPVEHEIYVGHPFSKNIYFPLATLEETLFMHRFTELTYFLQCLGATQIEIISKRGKNVTETESSVFNLKSMFNINLPNFKGKGNVNVNTEKNDSKKSDFNQNISRVQKFSPTKKPFLPDDLVWYEHETDWQILYKQRINGNLLYDRLIISSTQHQTITNSEKKRLQSDFEYYASKAKVDISKNNKSMFQEKEIIEWEIKVDFASVETLTSNIDNEQKYIDELKFMLSNDETISNDERRILKRKQEELGISAERAIYLEKQLIQEMKH